MSHFRLWRRMRRLADYLSLFFVQFFVHIFASTIFFHRAVLPHHAASGWHGGFRTRPIWPRLPASRRRSRFDHRRYLAMMGMLLALSLEICGCNLAQDSAPRFEYSSGSQPTQRPLLAEQRLAFYDPAEVASAVPSAPLIDGEILPPVRPPLREAKLLPWAIPESVYFVYKAGERGLPAPGRKPLATAFVLSVPDRGHRRYARFLVTARHVVDPEWAHCPGKNPAEIDLRLNRRSGGIGYETISLLSKQRPRFLTPSDSTADLAVIPLDEGLIPNLDEYKFIDVPFRLLPTDSETFKFRAEEPVMTARVPSWPSGEPGNYPVFDAGILAEMPAEAVTVQCGVAQEPASQAKPLHVWFIDAGIPQGASGAPVYTAIARGPGTAKTPVLLGIQSVAWPDQGVAGITPSFVLRDLIQTALRDERVSMDFYKGPNPWPQETVPSLY